MSECKSDHPYADCPKCHGAGFVVVQMFRTKSLNGYDEQIGWSAERSCMTCDFRWRDEQMAQWHRTHPDGWQPGPPDRDVDETFEEYRRRVGKATGHYYDEQP